VDDRRLRLRPKMTATTRHCPACQALYQEDDRFCEHCGATLPDADHAREPSDRVERDLTVAAGVSDRGLVHGRNEDAFRLELDRDGSVAVVICDGTSSASAGNAAAREAAEAAEAVLLQALREPAQAADAAVAEAILAAEEAVVRVPWTTRTRRVDPSCTLVAALCRGSEIGIGWVGDSRAYWLGGDGPEQLTIDDSFAAEGVAKGLLTAEQAANSPFLHAITHWVGPNSPERPPNTKLLHPDRPGRLLLCTDGLWNYVPTIPELSQLLNTLSDDAPPIAVAGALVDSALARGGEDNITVAVIDVSPTA
jgi:serine/threonine protein phosphatase PrpC